ncbi:MAG TPA: radical SAM protein [Methylomirabilota bacterium]|nr:radical SAM protein [Methylomirabilota bacterium]
MIGTHGLAERLATLTVPGALARTAPDDRIECIACAHRCRLVDGATGRCGARFRRGVTLRVPFGYVGAWRVMPVERNTIYHLRPGRLGLTFGMFGCDLRCPWCSNAQLSQALRDASVEAPAPEVISARALVARALAAGCASVVSAFNEPMITAEWAYAVFAEARRRGLATAVVSDGNTTAEALEYLRPVTDVFRVDLKGTRPHHYREVGGVADAPLAALRRARRLGYWVEAVTMLVPGANDDLDGLRALAGELAAIDPELPWHLNGFVPRYRRQELPPQSAGRLLTAAGIAYAAGLRHVYVGNVADRVTGLSHTRCPRCHEIVVRRANYATQAVTLRGERCPRCERRIAGCWGPR